MKFHVYKYGMRIRPYDFYYDKPNDGFVCSDEGGNVNGQKYYRFIYYINQLDKETMEMYDLDYLNSMYLKAEETSQRAR